MKIYLAMVTGLRPDPCPPRVLLSYHQFRTAASMQYYLQHGCDIFIDSGAFSAWTLGQEIPIRDYAKFCRRWDSKVQIKASLDDILSVEKSESNLQMLESLGANVTPVFHMGEPYEVFDDLSDRYPYVLCGGTGSVTGDPRSRKFAARADHFTKVFDIAESKGTLVHGFGVTDFRLLKMFPWHTVDSSTWASGGRYGRITLFDPDRGTMVNIKTHRWAELVRYGEVLRKHYNTKPKDLVSGVNNVRFTHNVAIKSWLLAEEWLNARIARKSAAAT